MSTNPNTSIQPINDYIELKAELNFWKEQCHTLQGKASEPTNITQSIFIKDNGVQRRISISDIIFLKAESNYTSFFLVNGQRIITSKTLGVWIDILQNKTNHFHRVHRGYYINVQHITSYLPNEKQLVLTDIWKIKIARRNKFDIFKTPYIQ